MTVTVPGTRQEIAKRTGRKVQPPQVFKAKLLAGRVNTIWINHEHGTKEYFDRDCARIVHHAKNAYSYLHAHGGDLLRDVRSMFTEVQWKVIADFPKRALQDQRHSRSDLGGVRRKQLLNNLFEDVVLVDRLKEKAGKNIGECTDFLDDGPDTLLNSRDI